MPQRSRVVSVPAPVGGWNDRDARDEMPLSDALRLKNWFPGTTSVKIRAGCAEASDCSESDPVDSLIEHAIEGGTLRLIGACNNKLWDFTPATANEITGGSAITTDRWYFVQMNHTLLMFNGIDQPRQFKYVDAATNASDATYTGTDPDSVALNDSRLIMPTNYRDRLYVLHNDESWFWYGGSQAITGALTPFDLSYVLRKGGDLQLLATYSVDDGGGADDRLVIMSSEGELLIYEGAYPAASDWRKVGHYFLPRPIGRRSFVQLDSDLGIMTERGVVPLSGVISKGDRAGSYIALSDKIQNAFRSAVNSYGARADSWAWNMVSHPQGPWLLVNIPVTVNSSYKQYVMNLLTGAWCEFAYGKVSICWATYDKDIYFGNEAGKVYKANTGDDDDGTVITTDLVTAYNRLEGPSLTKHINMVRPIFYANDQFDIGVETYVDYEDPGTTVSTAIALTYATADERVDRWYGASKIGRSAAIRLECTSNGMDCNLYGFNLNYTPGGVL